MYYHHPGVLGTETLIVNGCTVPRESAGAYYNHNTSMTPHCTFSGSGLDFFQPPLYYQHHPIAPIFHQPSLPHSHHLYQQEGDYPLPDQLANAAEPESGKRHGGLTYPYSQYLIPAPLPAPQHPFYHPHLPMAPQMPPPNTQTGHQRRLTVNVSSKKKRNPPPKDSLDPVKDHVDSTISAVVGTAPLHRSKVTTNRTTISSQTNNGQFSHKYAPTKSPPYVPPFESSPYKFKPLLYENYLNGTKNFYLLGSSTSDTLSRDATLTGKPQNYMQAPMDDYCSTLVSAKEKEQAYEPCDQPSYYTLDRNAKIATNPSIAPSSFAHLKKTANCESFTSFEGPIMCPSGPWDTPISNPHRMYQPYLMDHVPSVGSFYSQFHSPYIVGAMDEPLNLCREPVKTLCPTVLPTSCCNKYCPQSGYYTTHFDPTTVTPPTYILNDTNDVVIATEILSHMARSNKNRCCVAGPSPNLTPTFQNGNMPIYQQAIKKYDHHAINSAFYNSTTSSSSYIRTLLEKGSPYTYLYQKNGVPNVVPNYSLAPNQNSHICTYSGCHGDCHDSRAHSSLSKGAKPLNNDTNNQVYEARISCPVSPSPCSSTTGLGISWNTSLSPISATIPTKRLNRSYRGQAGPEHKRFGGALNCPYSATLSPSFVQRNQQRVYTSSYTEDTSTPVIAFTTTHPQTDTFIKCSNLTSATSQVNDVGPNDGDTQSGPIMFSRKDNPPKLPFVQFGHNQQTYHEETILNSSVYRTRVRDEEEDDDDDFEGDQTRSHSSASSYLSDVKELSTREDDASDNNVFGSSPTHSTSYGTTRFTTNSILSGPRLNSHFRNCINTHLNKPHLNLYENSRKLAHGNISNINDGKQLNTSVFSYTEYSGSEEDETTDKEESLNKLSTPSLANSGKRYYTEYSKPTIMVHLALSLLVPKTRNASGNKNLSKLSLEPSHKIPDDLTIKEDNFPNPNKKLKVSNNEGLHQLSVCSGAAVDEEENTGLEMANSLFARSLLTKILDASNRNFFHNRKGLAFLGGYLNQRKSWLQSKQKFQAQKRLLLINRAPVESDPLEFIVCDNDMTHPHSLACDKRVEHPKNLHCIECCDVASQSHNEIAVPSFYEFKKLVPNKASGETILHTAARRNLKEMCLYLIHSNEYDINQKENAGYTPLQEACLAGSKDALCLLLKHGADPNCSLPDGTRPLHDAIEMDDVSMVKLLLSFGADPTLKTYVGKSCLDYGKSIKMKTFLKKYIALYSNSTTQKSFLENANVTEERALIQRQDLYDSIPNFDEVLDQFYNTLMFEISDKPFLKAHNISHYGQHLNVMLLSDVSKALNYDQDIASLTNAYPDLKNYIVHPTPHAIFKEDMIDVQNGAYVKLEWVQRQFPHINTHIVNFNGTN